MLSMSYCAFANGVLKTTLTYLKQESRALQLKSALVKP